MIPTIGHVAVLTGLALTTYGGRLRPRGAQNDGRLLASARQAVIGSFVAALVGCVAMAISAPVHDFSVLYVAENNATTTAAVHQRHQPVGRARGSILFWTLLATGLGVARAVAPPRSTSAPHALGRGDAGGREPVLLRGPDVAGESLPPHCSGRGGGAGAERPAPEPSVHPLHPPLLYLGYTGLAVPFAFGIAALVTRRLDEEWLRIVRRWTLVPWTFLTLGITAGAGWSYEVLGWGSYWAWDPVENAALLPWLAATAFLHLGDGRGASRGPADLDQRARHRQFVLTLVGTFLTRSGVVASVHSFTQSAIGPWFLAGIVVALAVGLLVWRLPDLIGRGVPRG